MLVGGPPALFSRDRRYLAYDERGRNLALWMVSYIAPELPADATNIWLHSCIVMIVATFFRLLMLRHHLAPPIVPSVLTDLRLAASGTSIYPPIIHDPIFRRSTLRTAL